MRPFMVRILRVNQNKEWAHRLSSVAPLSGPFSCASFNQFVSAFILIMFNSAILLEVEQR